MTVLESLGFKKKKIQVPDLKPLKERMFSKGGVNDPPKTPRPTEPPAPLIPTSKSQASSQSDSSSA
ncbi:MAG: hypothetical protein P9X24_14810 [Candidatus Hatepunaea meridiana]|nr:hypothetical protein [Candidatus Hatepunaea meridiana]